MGAWGVGILQDDVAVDVYTGYLDMYHGGEDQQVITGKLLEEYPEALVDPHDNVAFWLALAKAQWDCGLLQRDVYNMVVELIHEETNVEKQDKSKPEIKKRSRVLKDFLCKVSNENKKPLRRRKTKHISAPFFPGDCIAVSLSDGDYGAALVLATDNTGRFEGLNLVCMLRYKRSTPPTLEDFQKRDWLLLNHHKWENVIARQWCLASYYEDQKGSLKKVGTVELNDNDPVNNAPIGGWSLNIPIEDQYKWESKLQD